MYISLTGLGRPRGDDTDGSTSFRRTRVPSVVIGLGFTSLLTDISSESVAAILPVYITLVVGLGPLAFGFLDGIYQGVSSVVRIGGGWWSDRSGRPKWVAFVGYGVSAVSRLALLVSTGFWALTAIIAVDRLGKGLRTAPRDSLIAAASSSGQLGRNFGVHRALDTTGALIGPLLAFAVLAAFPIGLSGYHVVFACSAGFAFVGLAVLGLLVPDLNRGERFGESEPEPVSRPATDQPGAQAATATVDRLRWADLRTPQMSRLLVACLILSLPTISDGFLYLMLQQSGNISPTLFPLLFVATNLVYLTLAVPVGAFADRVGRVPVFMGGFVLVLGAYLVAGFGGASHPLGVVLVLGMLGTFYAATDGMLAALASRAVPEQARASGISAAQTVVAAARFLASIAFGLLWQLVGMTTATTVFAAVLLVAVMASTQLLRPRRLA